MPSLRDKKLLIWWQPLTNRILSNTLKYCQWTTHRSLRLTRLLRRAAKFSTTCNYISKNASLTSMLSRQNPSSPNMVNFCRRMRQIRILKSYPLLMTQLKAINQRYTIWINRLPRWTRDRRSCTVLISMRLRSSSTSVCMTRHSLIQPSPSHLKIS